MGPPAHHRSTPVNRVVADQGQPVAGQNPTAAPAWCQPLPADEAHMHVLDIVNKHVFGHNSFRAQQRAIVESAVRGDDIFVLMPTGGGKSLCYQVCLAAV